MPFDPEKPFNVVSTTPSSDNNPGNVKTVAGARSGTQDFVEPDSPVAGVALTATTLRKGYQGLTLDQIAHKWAPDDSERWASNVSEISGIGRNDVPNLNDQVQLGKLIHAIANEEKAPKDRQKFTPDVIAAGIKQVIGQTFNPDKPFKTLGRLENPHVDIKVDPKTGIRQIVPKAEESLTKRAKQFSDYFSRMRGHLPDEIDYDVGTDFNDRMALSMMDNDKERRAYLEDRYGRGNVGQDPAGTFYIVKNGKKIAPSGGGLMEGFAADIAGNFPMLVSMGAGASAGAGLGAAAGGVGAIPGAIIGAMVGATAGKGVQEAEKVPYGYVKKTPTQEVGSLGKAGMMGGVAEIVSRPGAALAYRVLKGGIPEWISGATPETAEMTAQTLRMGGVPPTRSALPHLKATQFHQALGEKVVGNLIEARNLRAIQGEMENVLRSSGMTDAEIPQAMSVLMNPSEAPSYAGLGAELKGKVQEHIDSLVNSTQTYERAADEQLDKNLASLRLKTRAPLSGSPGIAANVAHDLIIARQDFSKAAESLYKRVDELVGDKPVVPTYLAKRYAQRLLTNLPESGTKSIIKEIAELRPQETFSNMQRIRTRLRELGEPKDLAASGVTKRDLRNLKTMVDESFDRAFMGKSPQAAKVLQIADNFYANGIKKFNDTAISGLIDGIRTGIYPDAGKIASVIFRPGEAERASTVLKMLSPEVRHRVQAEYFHNLIDGAVDRNTNKISGDALYASLIKQRGLLDVAFGKETGSEFLKYAQRLSSRNGKVSADLLMGDNIGDTIRAAQKSQQSLDKFLDDNYLSELAKPTLPPEEVYEHLVQPGNETELERAINFFGPSSAQVQSLRQTALVDLMHKAVTDIASGAGKTIGPDALDAALSRFSAKQQDLLFPNGLADDLRLVAKASKFLFPKSGADMAAGLAAGAIKSALPFGAVAGMASGHTGVSESAIVAYGWISAWNWILSRPATIRYLALGLRGEGAVRTVAIETYRNIVRASIMGMLPDTGDKK